NFNSSVGLIYDLKTSPKHSGVFVEYVFEINGKKLKAETSLNCPKLDCFDYLSYLLKGKYLAVIYEKSNPENSRMLLTEADYNKHNIELTPEENRIIKKVDSLLLK